MKTIRRIMPRAVKPLTLEILWDCCWAKPTHIVDLDNNNGGTTGFGCCTRCANEFARNHGEHRVHLLADSPYATARMVPMSFGTEE